MADLKGTLSRKIGPLPVWGYGAILVPLAAFYIHKRQVAQAAAAQQSQTGAGQSGTASNLGSAANVMGLTQMAYPMPYSSDTFVNIKNDMPAPTVNVPVNVGGPVINNPITTLPAPPAPAPAPTPAPQPAPPPKQTSITYVVQRGDTLWGIAQRFLGSGTKYGVIYNANSGLIEAIARQHGFSSSGGGHWIFPGESLKIPV
jgi:LysM repeat protein